MLAKLIRHQLEDIPASFAGPRWYAFYTVDRAEKAAGKAVNDMGYETFVPMQKLVNHRAKRKKKAYEKAVFTRYGFVRFDVNNPSWGEIVDCKDISYILRSSECKPQAIPDVVIDRFMRMDAMGAFNKDKLPKVGSDVEIAESPLAGIIGKIANVRNKKRMGVLMEFLGSKRVVMLPLESLKEA